MSRRKFDNTEETESGDLLLAGEKMGNGLSSFLCAKFVGIKNFISH
jgi:hypothetical protein